MLYNPFKSTDLKRKERACGYIVPKMLCHISFFLVCQNHSPLIECEPYITVKSNTRDNGLNSMSANILHNMRRGKPSMMVDDVSNQRELRRLAEISFPAACPSELQVKRGLCWQGNLPALVKEQDLGRSGLTVAVNCIFL